MKKNISEDAFKARVQHLAGVKNTSVNESKNRTLGTLIDVERAADGVAYGIVKEQHKYYIKKGGLNENLNVADFAYIGGVQNITEFQYSKLAEAKKNRNFLLQTINEGISTKVNPNGSKKVVLTEDKAGQEIEMAASKVGDLETATDAAAVPEPAPELPADDGAAEMDAGIDAMPADAPAEEVPAAAGEEMADAGEEMADAGEEMVDAGDEVAPEGGEEEVAIEDPETEMEREIEKDLGKITNKLRKTELTDSQVKSYVNTFLAAFKDKFPDIDIEDRKEMAEKITKVVPDSDIEDLGQSVEDEEAMEDPMAAAEEPEMAEAEECSECGGFARYAESRGYDAQSMMECGEEEMTNLVSGYANAHGEGQNDGDFKAVALFITPEIIEKLKGDYGHDDFANEVEPFANEMNETSAEDKEAQINELFGNLGSMIKGAAGKVAGDVAGGVKKGAQAVGQKAQQVGQAVGDYATGVKQAAHGAVVPKEVKKLEGVAADLGKQIDALNKRLQKAGKEPVNVKSILSTIANQVAGTGRAANLGGIAEGDSIAVEEPVDGTGIETPVNEEGSIAVEEPVDGTGIETPVNEEGLPVDSVEVQPPMEEEVDIKVSEKKGKPLSAEKAPEVEMKEGEEVEGEVIDDEEAGEESEEDVLDLTQHEKPEMPMIGGVDSMGGGVVKPEGAEATTVEVTKDSVKVEMNESEAKLRKYVRNRLEEYAGIKKPSLNESKKSEKLQKLDRIIEKQFKLFESEAKGKIDENINEVFGWSIKEKFAKLDPNDKAGVAQLFYKAFQSILNNPQMGAIYNAAKKTPAPERYEILKQYVEQGGGTLRLGNDTESVVFAPPSVKSAATPSQFSHGGTQGKTQLGGV